VHSVCDGQIIDWIWLTPIGNTVVVHCNGGKGRTGLVVSSCLLVLSSPTPPPRSLLAMLSSRSLELVGGTPSKANQRVAPSVSQVVLRVRSARKGTITNPLQLSWLHHFRSLLFQWHRFPKLHAFHSHLHPAAAQSTLASPASPLPSPSPTHEITPNGAKQQPNNINDDGQSSAAPLDTTNNRENMSSSGGVGIVDVKIEPDHEHGGIVATFTPPVAALDMSSPSNGGTAAGDVTADAASLLMVPLDDNSTSTILPQSQSNPSATLSSTSVRRASIRVHIGPDHDPSTFGVPPTTVNPPIGTSNAPAQVRFHGLL
jgi:hypothetical protein